MLMSLTFARLSSRIEPNSFPASYGSEGQTVKQCSALSRSITYRPLFVFARTYLVRLRNRAEESSRLDLLSSHVDSEGLESLPYICSGMNLYTEP